MKQKETLIDFIGIGAQKAGSAWLFSRLNELPEFTLPYEKEFHYFDKGKKYRKISRNTNDLPVLIYNAAYLKIKKVNRIFNINQQNSWVEASWRFRYNFLMNNDQAYLSLFNGFKGITGEVTPDYSALYEEDIFKMHRLLPDIKLIFIIRNPIDRAWSHFKSFNRLNKGKLKNIEKVDEKDIIAFMKSDYQLLRSDYFRTLEQYTKYYSNDQIFIGFFDAIKEQPLDLLTNIVRFLGADPFKIDAYCNLKAKNNESLQINMPVRVKETLKEMYFPMIEKSAKLFNGYCSGWLEHLNGEKSTDSTNHPSVYFLS